ncbi:MAG: histidine--tRNA ligase [candidate division Zixibacteria bacterium RBG_16_48_11]|nr:MAG: histidine--tRNA ligase [candidate division Zixibacteria bacterium RBG_16_48_11]
MTNKTKLIKPSLPKGTRDILPRQLRQREKVILLVKSVFEKYGYQPLETPALENLEVLSGKYGEEGEKLIFKILKRGEELKNSLGDLAEKHKNQFNSSALADLGLRYDLTVPLARVIAMYQNEIKLPFKRYQIQPVWRADRPQKGRYREFYQCDVDVVGTASMLADAEIIQITYEILKVLGFKQFAIRVNHRKILTGLVEYCGVDKSQAGAVILALDKFDKIGREGVKEELKARGIPEKVGGKLLPVLELCGDNQIVLKEIEALFSESVQGTQGVKETQQWLEYIRIMGIPEDAISLDLYLARGLEYYTGPIFESVVEKPKIGSLTGGGRYDQLIGMFLGREIPATGTTIGIERIIDVMSELRLLEDIREKTDVLVTIFNPETRTASLRIAAELRKNDINCETYLEDKDSLREQIGYANSKGIRLAVIVGPQEERQNQALVKDLRTGEQKSYSQAELSNQIRKLLSD